MKNSRMITPKNKLFSIKISAGSRNYCIDIKTSVDGKRYLIIKELQKGIKKGQIMIFEEYFQDFRKGYRKAIRTPRKFKFKAYDIEKLRPIYPKAYELWIKDEENELKKLWAHNKTIKEISDKLQRKPGAVRSRLKKLEKLGLL